MIFLLPISFLEFSWAPLFIVLLILFLHFDVPLLVLLCQVARLLIGWFMYLLFMYLCIHVSSVLRFCLSSFVSLFCRLGVRWDCFFLSMFVVQFYCWVLLIHLCILLFGKCWFCYFVDLEWAEIDFLFPFFMNVVKSLFFVDFFSIFLLNL